MAETSANFNISRFKDVIEERQGGLTKGTFFVCRISPSTDSEDLGFGFIEDDLLVCKAVNLPAEQLNFTTLKYHTRAIKIPTTREFGPITLSFYNTGDYYLRSNFFNWMNMYNSSVGNLRGLRETYHQSNDVRTNKIAAANYGNFKGASSYAKMFATMELFPFTNGPKSITNNLESNNRQLASYKFTYVFPTNIGPLQFSYDDDVSFQTYDVEFQYLDMRYSSTQNENASVEQPPAAAQPPPVERVKDS